MVLTTQYPAMLDRVKIYVCMYVFALTNKILSFKQILFIMYCHITFFLNDEKLLGYAC